MLLPGPAMSREGTVTAGVVVGVGAAEPDEQRRAGDGHRVARAALHDRPHVLDGCTRQRTVELEDDAVPAAVLRVRTDAHVSQDGQGQGWSHWPAWLRDNGVCGAGARDDSAFGGGLCCRHWSRCCAG